MSQCFAKPYEHSSWQIINLSDLAAKSDLASLKAEVDNIDLDKLKIAPVDLDELSNTVDYDVVKNTIYDKLVTKVNAIDSSKLV